MVQDFLQVSFDPVNKIWKSVNYPYKDQVTGTLGEKFLKTMRSVSPNKIIDHFYDTNTMKTAKEVYEQSILVAKNLQRLGISKGDVVVLFSVNNALTSVLTFGCILIGAIVNFFEVNMGNEHIDLVFDILQPTLILYEEKYKSKCFQSLERKNQKTCKYLISIDRSGKMNVQNELLQSDSSTDFTNYKSVEIKDPELEVACLVLTSGSTGMPKIVQITHTLMMHGILICWNNKTNYEQINSESVVFCSSPIRWLSQIAFMFQSMLLGIKRVSCCRDPTGKYGLELLRTTGVTHMFSPPSIFYNTLLQLDENDIDSLKSIKFMILGGEPAYKNIMELVKKHAVNSRSFYCYGMTEMSGIITIDEHINGGKLLPGYELQILDDDLKPMGPNQSGQLAIKPPYPLLGYKGKDNSKCFNELKLFINGDYGFVDEDKNLHILARYEDLIKSNKFILIPNSLESLIVNLPEVNIARVSGYRKSPKDLNDVAAVFVVINPKATCTHQELSAKILSTLKSQLSTDELAIIQDIHFVDTMPLTFNCGKIDRAALKQLALKKSQI